MSESDVDWIRLMNEANSDGNFVYNYCNILPKLWSNHYWPDGLPKKVSVNMTRNAPVDWTRLIQEMNTDGNIVL